MRQDIKERIEQARRGEVPEGYQTNKEIGLAPADWVVGKMSDVLHNEQRPVAKPSEPYWRLGLRSHAKGTFHELVENPEEVNMDELYKVREDDLIVNITFAWEHAVALADSYDDGLLVSHRFPTYVFDKSNSPQYFKAMVTQRFFKDMLGNISPGGAGRNRVMSKLAFLNLPCYIPAVLEQEKIAEILSCCDKVIELKKQLIEEKRRQKKWLMDKFFSSVYAKVEPLGKLCKIIMGQSPSSESYNTDKIGMPLIQGGADIINGIATPRYYTLIPTKFCEPSDIILTVRAPVGSIAKSLIRACIGRGVCAIRPYQNTSYIYQFLKYYEKMWSKISQGSTFDAVSGDEIKNISIPVSKNTKNVSNVLTAADREINLLEQELAEWQTKKKSLMQLLLTGIVRVATSP